MKSLQPIRHRRNMKRIQRDMKRGRLSVLCLHRHKGRIDESREIFEKVERMKTIFGQRERVNQSPTRSGWSGRRGGVGGHKRDNCRLPALFFCVIALLPGCATRRYVREQIAINNCVQTLRAIDRESGILYVASEMDAERSGPQRSEIGQKAYDKTVYEMFLRLKTRNETTQKINEVGQ